MPIYVEYFENTMTQTAKHSTILSVTDDVYIHLIQYIASSDNMTPLYEACRQGQHEIVLELMNVSDIDINAQRESNGETPLIRACRKGNVECVRALLSCPNIDINHQDLSGATALWTACKYENIEIVELLLSPPHGSGANPNLPNSDGHTPLWIMASSGNMQCMEILIKYGADLNIRDNLGGATPLFEAVRNGRTEAVRTLIGVNADVNLALSEDSTTPLMMAAHNGHIDIVVLLLDSGADPVVTNKQNVNCISCAAMAGHLDILKILHKAVVKVMDSQTFADFVNVRDSVNGWNPLHLACMEGHADVVKYLVEEIKVDVHIKDFENKSSLDHAQGSKAFSVIFKNFGKPQT